MDIYTDGSCLNNPGIGGWAFIMIHNDGITSRWANSQCSTTNNIMELTAAIKALEFASSKDITDVNLYTDSNYVKNGITQWIHSWKQNGWKSANNKSIKNDTLWKTLDSLSEQFTNLNWIHVKAHSTNKYNNMVDKLAREAAENKVSEVEF